MDQYSAVVVRVRKDFLQWLQSQPGLRRRTHHPEQDMVWLIPSTSTFSDEAALAQYLLGLRDTMLRAELERFGPGALEAAVAAKGFDEILELEIRADVQVAPPAAA